MPASIRSAFHKLTTDRHKGEGARDQFAAAWKAYLRAKPTQDLDENLAAKEALFAMLGADSDGEGCPAGGGADPAEAMQTGFPGRQVCAGGLRLRSRRRGRGRCDGCDPPWLSWAAVMAVTRRGCREGRGWRGGL